MNREKFRAQWGLTAMPSEYQLRRDICEVGRRIWQRGFVAANDGNITVRLGDQ